MGTKNQRKPEKRGLKVCAKHLPEDVHEIILKAKKDQDSKCKCSFSLESTIYLIVRQFNLNGQPPY